MKYIYSLLLLTSLSLFVFLPINAYSDTSTTPTTGKESASQYVKGSTITADVKARLLADPDVKSMHISVKTVKGVVTLSGKVESADQKQKAVAIASQVNGVSSVKDKLVIKPKKK